MEAIKYLAWHLLHSCEDINLHEKLTSFPPNDRKQIVQLIQWCLQNGKKIQTLLTQAHLNEITAILQYGEDEEVEDFHFHLTMYVFTFGMEMMKVQIDDMLEAKED
ncbi:hypothetical protein MK805_15120 [Shimazuella sp. AN120528]|uniref:hypothetical protein n=1 Tax=Shimazuella soli TaxID=1892854 RepID=UPI001F103607|nr:hypothetical protein [Shimazuella soli]MCH5586272.1 hypothetical protein [Shimazuella soli]